MRDELAGEDGEIAESIVGVRVVHDDGEGLACIDGLKAAGHGLEMRDGGDEFVEGYAASVGGGKGGEEVQYVDFAGEMRGDAGGPSGGFEMDVRRRE